MILFVWLGASASAFNVTQTSPAPVAAKVPFSDFNQEKRWNEVMRDRYNRQSGNTLTLSEANALPNRAHDAAVKMKIMTIYSTKMKFEIDYFILKVILMRVQCGDGSILSLP
ncbi:hypothetical protein [Roseobacter sp.]|uniref:hypothetical protein n=1 Tax=Roseobacter sp. TaxID=1907202 RepID=UPI002966F7BB|nr:hypothetical protein [Roseobacter sp.]MDW3181531.1 hypothetical protein [Roseobacter sp.]